MAANGGRELTAESRNNTDGEPTGAASAPAPAEDPLALPLDLVPFPVLRIDAWARVLYSNGVLEHELALQPDALRSRPLTEIVDSSSRSQMEALASSAGNEGGSLRLVFSADAGPVRRTFTVARQDAAIWLIGQPAELDAQLKEMAQERARAEAQADEHARVSAELKRANEQIAQRARELTDATEAKARFLATMSHELRTPLNAVLGYAGLLRDGVYGAVSEPQARAVGSIVRRAKDLQLMIDDVLDLAKIEAGRMELRADEFDPAAVVSDVKDAVASLAATKELGIIVRYNLRRAVRLDRAKYQQIVTNLVSNAIKFTPRRGEIAISIEQCGADHFRTSVRDTGIGIAPDDLSRIFENFQQLDGGTTRRFQGIGLGLAVVRRLVALMDGTISARSVPGQGATFEVELPIEPGKAGMADIMDVIPAEQASSDPIVLAIDDDPEVIALLRDSLAPAHFRVVGAVNGSRGLELAHILKPLAITLDIMMPEKDGWQVLREIKADPAIRDIPVIIMSIVSERALGLSLGATDYLVKPVDRGVLIGVLERLRDRHASRTALVLDEDFDARTLMGDLLHSLGYAVRLSPDAADALHQLESERPDVLFLTLTLDDPDDVTRILDVASSNPRYAEMRTVVVTRADVDVEQAERIRRAADTVIHDGTRQPEHLLGELRAALRDVAPARHS